MSSIFGIGHPSTGGVDSSSLIDKLKRIASVPATPNGSSPSMVQKLDDTFDQAVKASAAKSSAELIQGLNIEELHKLLEGPSNWSSRELLGLRPKEYSYKLGGPRQLVDTSRHTGALRGQWKKIIEEFGLSEIATLEAGSNEASSSDDYETAFNLMKQVVSWGREYYGEADEKHYFVKSVDKLLEILGKIEDSSQRTILDFEILKYGVKMLHMASPDNKAMDNQLGARSEAHKVFTKHLRSGLLGRPIYRLVLGSQPYQEPIYGTDRLMLQVWSKILTCKDLWQNLTDQEYEHRRKVNDVLVKIKERSFLPLADFIMRPKPDAEELPARFLADLSNEFYQEGEFPAVDEFCDLLRRRNTPGSSIRNMLKSPATMSIVGPSSVEKSAAVRQIALCLNTDMVEIRNVDVRDKRRGQSEKILRQILKQAKDRAIRKKVQNIVVVIQNIDGITTARQSQGSERQDSHNVYRAILTTLLDLMEPESLEYDFEVERHLVSGQVIVVASTTDLDSLDHALVSRCSTIVELAQPTPQQNLAELKKISDIRPHCRESLWLMLAMSRISKDDVRDIGSLVSSRLQGNARLENEFVALVLKALSKSRTLSSDHSGSLVTNSSYILPVSAETAPGSGVQRTIDLQVFKVSISELLRRDRQGLDLAVHPFVTFFKVSEREFILVANTLGVTIYLADAPEDKREPMTMYGCFPGQTSCQNLETMKKGNFSPQMSRLTWSLSENDDIGCAISMGSRRVDGMTILQGLDSGENHQENLYSVPIFEWHEIVEGEFTFQDAKKGLGGHERDTSEMSLEFYIEM